MRRSQQFSTQKKAPISFKLDLSKCTQEQGANPVVDFTKLLDGNDDGSDSPAKSYEMQKSPQKLKLNAPMVVKKQVGGQTQLPVSLKQKQIIIPRLALHDIQRQASECLSLTKADAKPRDVSVVHTKPKNLKLLSSKRDSFCEPSEIVKTLSATHENELELLKSKFEIQADLIKSIKTALGNDSLPDREIVPTIIGLKDRTETERLQMTIEDLTTRLASLSVRPAKPVTAAVRPKNTGGLTLRVRNISQNESLTDIKKGFSTMFEIKTGRLPVAASQSKDLPVPNESLNLDGSRKEKSVLEDFPIDPLNKLL